MRYFKEIRFNNPNWNLDHRSITCTEESIFTINVLEVKHHISFTCRAFCRKNQIPKLSKLFRFVVLVLVGFYVEGQWLTAVG